VVSSSNDGRFSTPVQKFISSRLIKNAQVQGASFDKLRINSPEK
jgi:hypothetical protein